MLHDTAGLNEAEMETVPAKDALVNLRNLVHSLDDGINLLVYCDRGPKIKQNTVENYTVFYKSFCQEKVPVVIAITGLENENPPMESWWAANKASFIEAGMRFVGHACITAVRGRNDRFGAEYEESVSSVKRLIWRSYSRSAWKKERTSWLVVMLRILFPVSWREMIPDLDI